MHGMDWELAGGTTRDMRANSRKGRADDGRTTVCPPRRSNITAISSYVMIEAGFIVGGLVLGGIPSRTTVSLLSTLVSWWVA